jgi:hypothetical protein
LIAMFSPFGCTPFEGGFVKNPADPTGTAPARQSSAP